MATRIIFFIIPPKVSIALSFKSALTAIFKMPNHLATVALLMLFSSHSFAQTVSVRCKFSHGQATDFDKGIPNTSRVRGSDMPDLVFDQIDAKKGTARLIGNQGAGTVVAHLVSNNSVHLLEMTGSGSLNSTTIYSLFDPKGASHQYPVVHSRHINPPTASMSPHPSQYLGMCTKLL